MCADQSWILGFVGIDGLFTLSIDSLIPMEHCLGSRYEEKKDGRHVYSSIPGLWFAFSKNFCFLFCKLVLWFH